MDKKKIRIRFSVENKTLYALILLLSVVVISGLVLAYEHGHSSQYNPAWTGSQNPKINGHPMDEIDGLGVVTTGCDSNSECSNNFICLNPPNGVCVQCNATYGCTDPLICNLTTHTCGGGVPPAKSWVLYKDFVSIGGTGWIGQWQASIIDLPADCMNGQTCQVKYEVRSIWSSANGVWEKYFTQQASGSWTASGTTQATKLGTNGNSGSGSTQDIFAQKLGGDPLVFYFRFVDDCTTNHGSEHNANQVCLQIFLSSGEATRPAENHLLVWFWE